MGSSYWSSLVNGDVGLDPLLKFSFHCYCGPNPHILRDRVEELHGPVLESCLGREAFIKPDLTMGCITFLIQGHWYSCLEGLVNLQYRMVEHHLPD